VTQKIDLTQPDVQVKKSCCFFCHQNCGVLAYVKDGKVLAIEGDPDHPTNRGGLCCRGNIALKHLDHPARINSPLKRVGKRGSGQWEKVSWDSALDDIAATLGKIRDEFGAEAVATAGGTQRTDDWARRRFMNLFGSPNAFHNAHLCWIPTFMVETAIYGWCPFEIDLMNSRCLVLWGHNPAASGMPEMRGISDLKEAGLKLIVIDPKYTESAAKADIWLPLRPGSDIALALAWLNVISGRDYTTNNSSRIAVWALTNWLSSFKNLHPNGQHLHLVRSELFRITRMYATRKRVTSSGCRHRSIRNTRRRACMPGSLSAVTGNLDAPFRPVDGPAMDYITDEEMEANEWLPEAKTQTNRC
jgi:anaerobic selenocysteine-containing dehydrogenase